MPVIESAMWPELLLKVLLSYLLGSISGSILLGKIRGGVDIRTMGSGNAGGTNALRTQGLAFAIGVVIIDIGKGAIAAGVLPAMLWFQGTAEPMIAARWHGLFCGAAAVIGHVFPVWHGFRGGKGAATIVGALAALHLPLVVPMLLMWLLVVVLTGYVGLATICAAVLIPVLVIYSDLRSEALPVIFSIAMAIFVMFTHRANIARLRSGTENRMEKLMLLKPKSRESDNDDG